MVFWFLVRWLDWLPECAASHAVSWLVSRLHWLLRPGVRRWNCPATVCSEHVWPSVLMCGMDRHRRFSPLAQVLQGNTAKMSNFSDVFSAAYCKNASTVWEQKTGASDLLSNGCVFFYETHQADISTQNPDLKTLAWSIMSSWSTCREHVTSNGRAALCRAPRFTSNIRTTLAYFSHI